MRTRHREIRMVSQRGCFVTAITAPLPPADQALKRATRALVQAAGGIDQAAALSRLGRSQLAAAGSITEPDRWLPVDVLRDLMAVTHGHADQLAVLRLLAADAGCVLVPVIAPAIDPLASIAVLAKESADLVGALAVHAAGSSSAADIVREADELMIKVAGIRAAAAAILVGGI